MKPRAIFGGVVATLLASLFAAPVMAGPIQPFLDRLIREEQLPGAVLLVSGPKGRQIAASGVANRKTRQAMTDQTRFYIASSGKLVTAVVAHQLIKEQRIKLSDLIYPWVRDIDGIDTLRNIRTVTVEQLLKHRSGLAEYFTDEFEAVMADHPDTQWRAEESLAYAFGKRAQSKPDDEFNYTNTNYVLLGRLIAKADHTTYARSVQRRIFAPLGMSASSIGAGHGDANLAHGYTEDDNGHLQDVSYSGWNAITGDGAVVASAPDLEAFLFALFRDGRVLPPKTVARMCRPQREEPESGYGLGCSIEDTPWGAAWGHNGSISGFNAETWYLPKLGVAVIFLTNGDYQSEEPDIVNRAVKAYLKK